MFKLAKRGSFIGSFLVSLILHSAFMIVGSFLDFPKEKLSPRPQKTSQMRINITSTLSMNKKKTLEPGKSASKKKLVDKNNAKKNPTHGINTEQKGVKKGAKIKDVPSQSSIKILSYEELFQESKNSIKKRFNATLGDTDYKRKSYTGDHYGELIAKSSEFAGTFDLPLSYRRQLSEGSAFARISLLADKAIKIDYLGGTQTIRAALFESLKRYDARKVIVDLFTKFGSNKIKITMSFKTVYRPDVSKEFGTKYNIHNNEIEIEITRFKGFVKKIKAGIAIEDEHSIKAKERDLLHLKQLKQSPAYTKTLTDLILD